MLPISPVRMQCQIAKGGGRPAPKTLVGERFPEDVAVWQVYDPLNFICPEIAAAYWQRRRRQNATRRRQYRVSGVPAQRLHVTSALQP